MPKEEYYLSPADKLIRKFIDSKAEESYEVELDNLDRAKLVYDSHGRVVVKNEHGTQYDVSLLSDTEIKIFSENLT